MTPAIGRTVIFRLTADQAEQVNRRRTSGSSIAERIKEDKWPIGSQAHIGNHASPGQEYPLVITAVWPDEFGPGTFGVNGQAFLDGNDCLWVTSAKEGGAPGEWHWPVIVKG